MTVDISGRPGDRLQLLLNASEVGVWEWDPSTHAAEWSQCCEHLLGLAPGTYDGSLDGFLQAVYPDDRADVDARIAQAMSSTAPYVLEFRVGQPGKDVRWLETRGRVTAEGTLLAVLSDVSERRVADLERARLVQQKEEFLVAATHDLKTPLTIVKGTAQFMMQRLAWTETLDRNVLMSDLETLDDTVSKLSAMVNSLLDIARMETGHPLELWAHTVDLVALAREVGEEHGQRFRHHCVRVTASIPELIAEIDGFRVERVLNNLLSNAVKYSPAGGTIHVHVDCEERPDGAWAYISVRDHGMGIPEQDLPHIFERFFRAANVAGAVPGTGIGLAGALQIVRQNGGTIAVDSVEGKGSTFTVSLPLRSSRKDGASGGVRSLD